MLVDVTGKQTSLPTGNWSLSGILVRKAIEDRTRGSWVSFRSGAANGSPRFERKTTRDSHSDLVLNDAVPGWVDLRIVRVGWRFVLLRRYPGKRWRLHWVYARGDLPASMQVGSTRSRATRTRRPTSSPTWTSSASPPPACRPSSSVATWTAASARPSSCRTSRVRSRETPAPPGSSRRGARPPGTRSGRRLVER